VATARVSSRRFVGREPQLAELERVLARASSGDAWLALVAGESGVGKTRLVSELAARAREGGARVLDGDCVELAEGELPYAPLIGALRPLLRAEAPELDDVRAELDRPAADLATGTPQGRFFELLLTAFDRLGQERPLVLVLEDIHWADRSTRDFLAFLARNLCRERMLVVATYRTDELHRRHPLRPLLPEIERLDRTTRVVVERLDRAELAAVLADILGAEADVGLLERLYLRCEGNPLFAEELIAASADGRGELPPTLRDALMVRVEALPETTQELLRTVSGAARADEALLAQLSGLELGALRAALREGIAQQVIVADGEGRYAFRHALLREAIHDDLLPGEQVELHLALARALEERIADPAAADLDTVTAIAHHFALAGQQPEALTAAVRAAASAKRVHAPAEAAAQLERALALWPRVADAEARAGQDHVRLLDCLALAYHDLGDYERARHAVHSAIDELGPDAEPRRRARLLERLGRCLWHLGRGEETMATYEQGLALLDADEPTPERALLLAAKAKTLMLWGRYTDAVVQCEQALEAARAAGARVAESNALNTLGVARAGLGDLEGGIACLEQSIDMDWADDRIESVDRGYVNLGDVLLLGGRVTDALLLVTEGLSQLARHGRRPQWLGLQAAEIAFAAGDWEQTARWVAPDRAPRHVDTSVVYFDVIATALELARGETEAAVTRARRARALSERVLDPQFHAPLAALLAAGLRREGGFDEARAALTDAHQRLSAIARMQDHARLARLAAAAVAVEADAAQRARDLADPDAEAHALAGTQIWLARARGVAGTPGSAAWVAEAEAEATRAGGVSDPRRWADTAAAWDAIERPYNVALARWREAEALAQAGDRAAAEVPAAIAAELAAALGATWLAGEVASLSRRARLRLGAADGEAAAERGPRPPVEELGLTPRELEVLELVAEGRTNREIGEALFMAEKTASVHVSRILAKLDVRSRTEAAAVAHRLGLGI
jgi:ATP/maltotriose-dependent transcriptional regulator MalT